MLLRGSGEFAGTTFEDRAALDAEVESGVPHGRLLLAFAEAAVANAADLARRREDVLAALGAEALVDAAAVIAIFQAVVKIADATGIPLEDYKADVSRDMRADLGLDEFADR